MAGHIYRDVILKQHARLFRGVMGAEFLFVDDNARPHRANIVDECLQSEDITRMDWPAYSPDLNPIEHVKPESSCVSAQKSRISRLERSTESKLFPGHLAKYHARLGGVLICRLSSNLEIVEISENVRFPLGLTPSTAAVLAKKIRAHYEQLLEFERGRIIGLKEGGWANWRITRHMGRSDAAIRRCWKKWVNNGRFQRHDGSGRPRVTVNLEDRLIVRSAVTALDSLLSTIRRTTRMQVSTMTIYRRLIKRNLRSY
ncbi:HTH_Tnp_Tc3_2 domain-containing protein [Trichonephila clavipes]|nr:HTH_Tnp_Tc3_2 domain-containing protein [Trichonephila clavipes]